MTEIALTKARAKLTGLSRKLQKNPKSVFRITHRGKPAVTLMSTNLFETLVEALDTLSDQDALRRSRQDIGSPRVRTLDEVAARLRLRPRGKGRSSRSQP